MEVRCDKCQARYRVDDNRIGPQGLTMRCGKCQNTFKVTRSPPPPAENAGPASAPQKTPSAQTTMIFAAPSMPAKPPPRPAAAPPPAADEAAGRTMMFPSAPAPVRDAPPPPKQAPDPSASGTIVFRQPAARPSPAKPAAAATNPPAAKPPDGDAPPATMIFGGAPAQRKAAEPATVPAARTEIAEPEPVEHADAEAPEPDQDVEAEREPGPFDKAPPRGLLIGVAAGLGLLLVIGGTLVAYRKLAPHPPPPAAVETLASAQADADQDTLASLASAEAKARDALDAAGERSRFPEATATLARIGIQWADALNDEAARIAESNAGDPRVAQLQAEARGKLKSAFDLLSPAVKANKESRDLQFALADYYRAQRAPSSMNRYLKGLKEDPRAALVQGMALLDADEGAEKAIPSLKAAVATDPRSARVHFRLAQAYVAAKDEANARAEVEETLRLSPRHERAQALRNRLLKPGAAEKK
jgi:predicted Zn finger-like uncharacterized protein